MLALGRRDDDTNPTLPKKAARPLAPIRHFHHTRSEDDPMRFTRFTPIAVLAFAAACIADNPADPSVTGPGPLTAQGEGSPKYHTSDYSVGTSFPFTLSNSFKLTGMGSFTKAAFTLSAEFIATVTCINPSDKNEPQGNPFQIPGTVDASQDIEPSRNGSVSATISIGLPSTLGDADCSGNGNAPHTPRIDTVFWSDIKFCWGGGTLAATATAQGPIPGGPNSGVVLGEGDTASGIPLSGSGSFAQGGTGIFAACVSTEGN
jgi:hypothetical protein